MAFLGEHRDLSFEEGQGLVWRWAVGGSSGGGDGTSLKCEKRNIRKCVQEFVDMDSTLSWTQWV